MLVYQGVKQAWDLPAGTRAESFGCLISALQAQWQAISSQFPGVEDIRVIGIDLTKRGIDAKAVAVARRARAADANSDHTDSPIESLASDS